jgi:hypothetical protein
MQQRWSRGDVVLTAANSHFFSGHLTTDENGTPELTEWLVRHVPAGPWGPVVKAPAGKRKGRCDDGRVETFEIHHSTNVIPSRKDTRVN